MSVGRPTRGELAALAERLGLALPAERLDEYAELVGEALAAHDWLDAVADEPPEPPRRAFARPSPEENPYGGWYYKTDVRGAETGPLAGLTVALKDNICLAGVPMANGSAVLEGYVPDVDATVATRVLEAGGSIAGKAVCENLCLSGASHTSHTGPVRNPYDRTRSSGGSSSGCGALVAAGAVDLAIGGDQGGSIRCPSAWSGIVGLKPTFGLVPYTGAFPIEMTLDHLGPMARSVAAVALLLDVIAGPDGLDPRQTRPAPIGSFLDGLDAGVDGIRIGVLRESFGIAGASAPNVDDAVRAAAAALGGIGADVAEVSVPLHRDAGKLSFAIAAEGSTDLLLYGDGMGTNWRGLHIPSLRVAFAAGRRARPGDLAPMLKAFALAGQWLHDRHDGRYYSIAQNFSRRLARAYDDALADCDLLLLPTTPMQATPIPPPDVSALASARISHEMGVNTSQFNVTGHPALSVPCALSDGLPVGMMLVGRHGEDATLLRAAHAYETDVFRISPPAVAAERAEVDA